MTAIAIVGAVAIFFATERCFDDADLKNAVNMVETLRAGPTAPTIPEAVAQAYPGAGPIHWTPELRDKFFGFVHVTGLVSGAQTPDGKPLVYEFDVNLAGQRLHPGNDAARSLMRALAPDTRLPSAAPSGP